MKKRIVEKDTFGKGSMISLEGIQTIIKPENKPEFELKNRVVYSDGSESLTVTITVPNK